MASAVIGALRVNLGIDSAQFQNGLKQAQTGLDRFAKVATAGFAAVATAGVAMAGALAVGIKRTVDEADDMGKAAQKFGVAVDELSRLKHAADLSGVSMEGLGTGLRKLSQNMQEFANGANNQASAAFQALGVSVTNADGTLKSSTQVITDIAAKFALMEDGAQKTAIAMAIFGRSGTDLIPMLNAGADGLRSMMEEADALGIVIDTKTARAAEAFNDNLTRLEKAKDGVILKITSALLPALELLSEKFLKVAADGESITAISSGLISALSFIANEVAQLAILGARLSAEFAGVAEAFNRLNNYDFSGAWAAFQEGQNASAEMAAKIKADIEGIFDGSNISQGGIARRIDEAFGASGTTAAEKFVANFAAGTDGKKIKEKLDPIFREAAQVFDQTRTPLEHYQMAIGRLNAMLAAGAINQDTYNRAVIQAQDAFDKAEEAGNKTKNVFESIGKSISSSFASAFQGLIDGSKRVGDVLKDLLSQLSSMLLNQGFQALVGGFFGGSSFGTAGGFADMLGFARGGTIMPGGSGGIDSQLVAFRKSPNERVDITKPGQTLGRGGGGVADVRVYVDEDGNWQAKVEAISQDVSQKVTKRGLSAYDGAKRREQMTGG